MQNDQIQEQFSDDPEENLRIENDILKLKLRASYGAGMMMGKDEHLPPEIENEFLKHVIAFEEAMENEQVEAIFKTIGKPAHHKASSLADEQISTELERLIAIMADHSIQLDVLGNYDERTIYTFITEELFKHEVVIGSSVPGFTYHFIYEEFHPNHHYDIENRVREFFTDWFEQKFDEYSFELADQMIIANGTTMKKDELMNKIQIVFDSYPSFTDQQFTFGDISFQLDEANSTGMGYAEGDVKYYARLENGQQILIGGPFKFYLSLDDKWWQIFYFVFPGFEW